MKRVRPMSNEKTIRVLRVFRLALSGAIAGAAVIGFFFPSFGHFHGIPADAFGAGAGFAAVIGVKVAHLI